MSSYSSQHRGRLDRYFRNFVILVVLAIALMAAFHYFIRQPLSKVTSPIDKLAGALGSITDQRVVTDGYTLTLDSRETRELAVVKRHTQSVVKYETSFLGSKKILVVRGEFVVKAGFDLSEFEGFELKGKEVVGEWPEPRLLSVDMQDYQVFFSESGTINRLTDKDHERVIQLLNRQARRDAIEKSDILAEADEIIKTRLEDLTDGEVKFDNILP